MALIFGVNSANAQYKCTAAHPFHGIVVDESGELVFFATPQAAADGVMEFVNRRNGFFSFAPICGADQTLRVGTINPQTESRYLFDFVIETTFPPYCSGVIIKNFSYGVGNCEKTLNTVIHLTGPTDTRPKGTGGTSEITLTAKVTDGTTPKAGVALSFTVDVTANSGGHEHHSDARPKGL